MNLHDSDFQRPSRQRSLFLCISLRPQFSVVLMAAFLILTPNPTLAQGSVTLYGDLKVEVANKAEQDATPMSFDIILYTLGGNVVGRQTVSNKGRYRFLNLQTGGEFDLVVEVESTERARIRINLAGVAGSDQRQDIELAWKTDLSRKESSRKQTVSAADFYERKSGNQSLFLKAQEAVDHKRYPQAVTLFRQIVDADPQDFQAWSELGTAYLLQEKPEDAEQAYRRASEVRPTFTLAFLNLGRTLAMQKKFEAATEPLTRAVELQPASADANFLLGESYLMLKKGSKAVGYLSEAAKLGRYEGHLRLATLYNAAGMKDKAVAEYVEFLKKQPDYPDKKKLEQYIEANKKTQ